MAYAAEVREAVIERIKEGKSLRMIAEIDGMPSPPTVMDWVRQDKDFSEQYVRAKEVQAHLMAEEILSISDDGSNDTYTDERGVERTDVDVIARSKLRVDSRKWLLSKMLPKVYGDKLELDGKVDGDRTLTIVRRVLDSREDLKSADA